MVLSLHNHGRAHAKVLELVLWCQACGWQGSMRVVELVPHNDGRARAKVVQLARSC
jgi:hypothetical protein